MLRATNYAWNMRETLDGTPIRPLERLILLCLAECAGMGGDEGEVVFRRSYLIEKALIPPEAVGGVITRMEQAGVITVERVEILPGGDVRYTGRVFWNPAED